MMRGQAPTWSSFAGPMVRRFRSGSPPVRERRWSHSGFLRSSSESSCRPRNAR